MSVRKAGSITHPVHGTWIGGPLCRERVLFRLCPSDPAVTETPPPQGKRKGPGPSHLGVRQRGDTEQGDRMVEKEGT